jgi:hypothetical protein
MVGFEGTLAEISAEFPRFRLVPKLQNRFMAIIDRFLRIVTLGQQTRFLVEYHTVIGYTLYLAPTWEHLSDIDRIALLRHERVHLRQRRRYGFVGLAFLYLIPIFPLGLAYGRARLEWEAYSETLRALFELRGAGVLSDEVLRERIVGRFVGPDYGWMWPFRNRVEKWYDQLVLSLANEQAIRH